MKYYVLKKLGFWQVCIHGTTCTWRFFFFLPSSLFLFYLFTYFIIFFPLWIDYPDNGYKKQPQLWRLLCHVRKVERVFFSFFFSFFLSFPFIWVGAQSLRFHQFIQNPHYIIFISIFP